LGIGGGEGGKEGREGVRRSWKREEGSERWGLAVACSAPQTPGPNSKGQKGREAEGKWKGNKAEGGGKGSGERKWRVEGST